MTAASLRALLDGIVDYAGLFPPASLDMRAAVLNYREYLASSEAWALGRFVLPIARLAEYEDARRGIQGGELGSPPWRLSGLTGGDTLADIARAAEFNVMGGADMIDALETKLGTVDDIRRVASRLTGDMELFVEVPVREDPLALLRAVADVGAKAKIRTGGTTEDAFPSSREVARFIRRCVEVGAPFKATAGLHHPIRARYHLTYDPNAPEGVMFGFLNVFLAAALLRAGGSEDDAVAMLETTDAGDLLFDDFGLSWREHRLTTDQLRMARRSLARSFGSCSFSEPVDDLRALALI